jgi:ketosteroid isomerase-like protein
VSRQNITAVKSFFDAINRGEVDDAFDFLDPDFEWDMSRSINPDLKGVHRGREEVLRLFAQFRDLWEDFEWISEEVIDLGEKVVAVGGPQASGRSGIEVRARGAQVWEFKSGRPSAARVCQSKAEALELAGAE